MYIHVLAKTAESNEGSNVWETSLNILVTGIVVVFAVLLLLILLIKLYSTIVYKAQNRTPKNPKRKRRLPKGKGDKALKASLSDNGAAMAVAQPQGLTDELIAVITAAAVAVMGNSNIKVTGIRQRGSRSEWWNTGVSQGVKPFERGDWK